VRVQKVLLLHLTHLANEFSEFAYIMFL
jgi:hypothetical protein